MDKIIEYLCEFLHKFLKDKETCVQKPITIYLATCYGINVQILEYWGFMNSLQDLVADSNSRVANAVAMLSELSESHPNSNLFILSPQNISKVLTALNECSECDQIFIQHCLSNYILKNN